MLQQKTTESSKFLNERSFPKKVRWAGSLARLGHLLDVHASLPNKELLEAFSEFLAVDLCRNKRTAEEKLYYVKKFLEWLKNKNVKDVLREDVRSYLRGIDKKPTYTNTLKSLKVFFRDFLGKAEVVETFKKIEDELEAIPDFFPESIVIKKYLRTEWLPLIVEKISEILHEMEKDG